MRNEIGGILTKLRVIAVAVAVAELTAACSLGAEAAESPSEPIKSGAALNGTYRLDFDAAQQLAGGEPKPYDPFARWFAIRSTCSASGCIATGSRVKADDRRQRADPAFSVVLDWVGGEWVTTFARTRPAGTRTPRFWCPGR
jgi:serine/threonine protein kinase, bacterial